MRRASARANIGLPVTAVGMLADAMSFRNILAPVDLGPLSDATLSHALELARPFGSKLVILHVIKADARRAVLPPGVIGPPLAAPAPTPTAQEQRSRLRALASRHPLPPRVCIRVEIETTTESLAEGILLVADELEADLLVMGTHGRAGIKRVVLGSVAELVVRGSSKPVLLVPSSAARPVPRTSERQAQLDG